MRFDVAPVETIDGTAPSSRLTSFYPAPAAESLQPPSERSSLALLVAAIKEFCLEAPAHYDVVNVRTGEYARNEPFPDGTLADRFARELGSEWRVFRRGNGR